MKPRSHASKITAEVFAATTASDPFFWREQWRQLKLAHCAVPNYGNAREFWANKKMIHTVYMKGRKTHRKTEDARLTAMSIPDGARVLDIGAGPVTYAVPLPTGL